MAGTTTEDRMVQFLEKLIAQEKNKMLKFSNSQVLEFEDKLKELKECQTEVEKVKIYQFVFRRGILLLNKSNLTSFEKSLKDFVSQNHPMSFLSQSIQTLRTSMQKNDQRLDALRLSSKDKATLVLEEEKEQLQKILTEIEQENSRMSKEILISKSNQEKLKQENDALVDEILAARRKNQELDEKNRLLDKKIDSLEKLLDADTFEWNQKIVSNQVQDSLVKIEDNTLIIKQEKLEEVANCPITHQLPKKAVIDDQGHTYDEDSLKRTFQFFGAKRSPLTNMPIERVVENRAIQDVVSLIPQSN